MSGAPFVARCTVPGRSSVCLFMAALVSATACAPDETPPTAGPEVLREGVDMVLIDMEHYLTRQGVRRGRLLSDTAEYLSENEIHLRPVELTFFDDEGREVSLLTADFAVFNEVSEDMEATGNVVVLDRRDDGRLETEQIRYVKQEDRLYGDRQFVYESNGGRTVMRGDSFESDPGLDRIEQTRPAGSSEPRIDTLSVEPEETSPDSPPAEPPDSTFADSAEAAQDTAARDTAARDTTRVTPDSTVRDTTARAPTRGAATGRPMATAGRRERAAAGRG